MRRMIGWRVGLVVVGLVFGLAWGAGVVEARAQDDGQAAEPRSVLDVVREIEALGDGVPAKLFDELAGFRSARALTELKKLDRSISKLATRAALYRSLRLFRADERLATKCGEWLAGKCRDKDIEVRYAAAWGLATLGAPAADHVVRLARRAEDRQLVRAALPCILDRIDVEPRIEDLELVLEYYAIGWTGTEERLLTAFGPFSDKKAIRIFREFLDEEKGRIDVKAAAVKHLGGIGTSKIHVMLHGLVREPRNVPSLTIIDVLHAAGYREHIDDLAKLTESDWPAGATAGFVGLLLIESERAEWQVKLAAEFEADRFDRRLVAVYASGELLERGADGDLANVCHALIERATVDREATVRTAGLDRILEARERSLVPAVIARLDAPDKEEREKALEVLGLLTGENFGGSSGSWTRWWNAEGSELELPSREVAEERIKERQRRINQSRRTNFYGMNVTGDNVVILVDASGSMLQKNYWDETRLQIAKQELAGAIERLRDGISFNVVFFGSTLLPWKEQLVEMTPETRKEALEFVAQAKDLGGTAVYDALSFVFEDERVENVYLLSDGEPAGGTIDDPIEILEAVTKWSRRHRVTVNCISIGFRSEFLESLASLTQGRFREAE